MSEDELLYRALTIQSRTYDSTGFHAPQEAARILGESIDYARRGQVALRDGGPAAVKR